MERKIPRRVDNGSSSANDVADAQQYQENYPGAWTRAPLDRPRLHPPPTNAATTSLRSGHGQECDRRAAQDEHGMAFSPSFWWRSNIDARILVPRSKRPKYKRCHCPLLSALRARMACLRSDGQRVWQTRHFPNERAPAWNNLARFLGIGGESEREVLAPYGLHVAGSTSMWPLARGDPAKSWHKISVENLSHSHCNLFHASQAVLSSPVPFNR